MKEEIKASAAPARRRTTYANLKRDMEELQGDDAGAVSALLERIETFTAGVRSELPRLGTASSEIMDEVRALQAQLAAMAPASNTDVVALLDGKLAALRDEILAAARVEVQAAAPDQEQRRLAFQQVQRDLSDLQARAVGPDAVSAMQAQFANYVGSLKGELAREVGEALSPSLAAAHDRTRDELRGEMRSLQQQLFEVTQAHRDVAAAHDAVALAAMQAQLEELREALRRSAALAHEKKSQTQQTTPAASKRRAAYIRLVDDVSRLRHGDDADSAAALLMIRRNFDDYVGEIKDNEVQADSAQLRDELATLQTELRLAREARCGDEPLLAALARDVDGVIESLERRRDVPLRRQHTFRTMQGDLADLQARLAGPDLLATLTLQLDGYVADLRRSDATSEAAVRASARGEVAAELAALQAQLAEFRARESPLGADALPAMAAQLDEVVQHINRPLDARRAAASELRTDLAGLRGADAAAVAAARPRLKAYADVVRAALPRAGAAARDELTADVDAMHAALAGGGGGATALRAQLADLQTAIRSAAPAETRRSTFADLVADLAALKAASAPRVPARAEATPLAPAPAPAPQSESVVDAVVDAVKGHMALYIADLKRELPANLAAMASELRGELKALHLQLLEIQDQTSPRSPRSKTSGDFAIEGLAEQLNDLRETMNASVAAVPEAEAPGCGFYRGGDTFSAVERRPLYRRLQHDLRAACTSTEDAARFKADLERYGDVLEADLPGSDALLRDELRDELRTLQQRVADLQRARAGLSPQASSTSLGASVASSRASSDYDYEYEPDALAAMAAMVTVLRGAVAEASAPDESAGHRVSRRAATLRGAKGDLADLKRSRRRRGAAEKHGNSHAELLSSLTAQLAVYADEIKREVRADAPARQRDANALRDEVRALQADLANLGSPRAPASPRTAEEATESLAAMRAQLDEVLEFVQRPPKSPDRRAEFATMQHDLEALKKSFETEREAAPAALAQLRGQFETYASALRAELPRCGNDAAARNELRDELRGLARQLGDFPGAQAAMRSDLESLRADLRDHVAAALAAPRAAPRSPYQALHRDLADLRARCEKVPAEAPAPAAPSAPFSAASPMPPAHADLAAAVCDLAAAVRDGFTTYVDDVRGRPRDRGEIRDELETLMHHVDAFEAPQTPRAGGDAFQDMASELGALRRDVEAGRPLQRGDAREASPDKASPASPERRLTALAALRDDLSALRRRAPGAAADTRVLGAVRTHAAAYVESLKASLLRGPDDRVQNEARAELAALQGDLAVLRRDAPKGDSSVASGASIASGASDGGAATATAAADVAAQLSSVYDHVRAQPEKRRSIFGAIQCDLDDLKARTAGAEILASLRDEILDYADALRAELPAARKSAALRDELRGEVRSMQRQLGAAAADGAALFSAKGDEAEAGLREMRCMLADLRDDVRAATAPRVAASDSATNSATNSALKRKSSYVEMRADLETLRHRVDEGTTPSLALLDALKEAVAAYASELKSDLPQAGQMTAAAEEVRDELRLLQAAVSQLRECVPPPTAPRADYSTQNETIDALGQIGQRLASLRNDVKRASTIPALAVATQHPTPDRRRSALGSLQRKLASLFPGDADFGGLGARVAAYAREVDAALPAAPGLAAELCDEIAALSRDLLEVQRRAEAAASPRSNDSSIRSDVDPLAALARDLAALEARVRASKPPTPVVVDRRRTTFANLKHDLQDVAAGVAGRETLQSARGQAKAYAAVLQTDAARGAVRADEVKKEISALQATLAMLRDAKPPIGDDRAIVDMTQQLSAAQTGALAELAAAGAVETRARQTDRPPSYAAVERALSDLRSAAPGGLEALRVHVRAHAADVRAALPRADLERTADLRGGVRSLQEQLGLLQRQRRQADAATYGADSVTSKDYASRGGDDEGALEAIGGELGQLRDEIRAAASPARRRTAFNDLQRRMAAGGDDASLRADVAAYANDARDDIAEKGPTAASDELKAEVRLLRAQLAATPGAEAPAPASAVMEDELQSLCDDLDSATAVPAGRAQRRSTFATMQHDLADLRARAGGPETVKALEEQFKAYVDELKNELSPRILAASDQTRSELRDELRALQRQLLDVAKSGEDAALDPAAVAAAVQQPLLAAMSAQLDDLRDELRRAAAPRERVHQMQQTSARSLGRAAQQQTSSRSLGRTASAPGTPEKQRAPPTPETVLRRLSYATMQRDLESLKAAALSPGQLEGLKSQFAEYVTNLRSEVLEPQAEGRLATLREELRDELRAEMRDELRAVQDDLARLREEPSPRSGDPFAAMGTELAALTSDVSSALAPPPDSAQRRAFLAAAKHEVADVEAGVGGARGLAVLRDHVRAYSTGVRAAIAQRAGVAEQDELRAEVRALQQRVAAVDAGAADGALGDVGDDLAALRGDLRGAVAAPRPEARRSAFAAMQQDVADLAAAAADGRPAALTCPALVSALASQLADYVRELRAELPLGDAAESAEVRGEVSVLQRAVEDVRRLESPRAAPLEDDTLAALGDRLGALRDELRRTAPQETMPSKRSVTFANLQHDIADLEARGPKRRGGQDAGMAAVQAHLAAYVREVRADLET
ncbi:hypothetical protein M885DRAFT_561708, partial [Pelagophyceae sp. CCMP2097]